jgi:hypothetical protein
MVKKVWYSSISILILLMCTLFFRGAQEVEIPPHLVALRELLYEITPETTSYEHQHIDVHWKGHHEATKYVCHTDCSGLINVLLGHSYGFTKEDFRREFGKERPYACTYVDAIEKGRDFKQIFQVQDILPGDILAYKLPLHDKNTGHIMVIDEVPKQRESTPPVIEGTIQWEVVVIDCTESAHGSQDTRYIAQGKTRGGLGRGVVRLYSTPDGQLEGFSWSTSNKSKFYSKEIRPLVIGRIEIR